MTVHEYARKYGVHPNTVINWCRWGLIPCTVRQNPQRCRITDIPDDAPPPVRSASGRILRSEIEGVIPDSPPWEIPGQISCDELLAAHG